LDFCALLQSAVFSLGSGFGDVRGTEVERGLEAVAKMRRAEHMVCLNKDIVGALAKRAFLDLGSRRGLKLQVKDGFDWRM